MPRLTGISLIPLLLFLSAQLTAADIAWQQLEAPDCLPESLAERQVGEVIRGVMECITLAREAGLVVAQFRSDSNRCHVFRLRFVCHLVKEAKSPASLSHKCSVFATASALAFLRLSWRLSSAVGLGLRGAWVMGPDEEVSRTNLVCGETRLWQAQAIQWTAEGANFDGSSSGMTLVDVDFVNQPGELSVLVKVRRPIEETHMPLLIGVNCSTEQLDFCLWDAVPGHRGAYAYRVNVPSYRILYTDPSTNTMDQNVWAEFGFMSPSRNSISFFSNGVIVPSSLTIEQAISSLSVMPSPSRCLNLGFRSGEDTRRLKGLVQAVSIANVSLSLAQIYGFYDVVRG